MTHKATLMSEGIWTLRKISEVFSKGQRARKEEELFKALEEQSL